MTRIADTFARLRSEHRTGLVTYATAGDPDERRSAAILRTLAEAGADILEVGVPFSDPLADGPVIQRAAERALAGGTTLATTLNMVARIREGLAAPVVIFTYANPVLRMGIGTFAARAADAGVDGVLILDLPIEEAGPIRAALDSAGLDMIFLLSPTTTVERIRAAASIARGFLYGISRLGVTGMRDHVAGEAQELAARVRSVTALPLALGFGISRPEHVAQIGRWADAAVVGSGLVDLIARAGQDPDLERQVAAYVRWLKGHAEPVTVAGRD